MMENKGNDPIETFVRANREAFDDQMPTEKVWQGVSGRVNPQPNKRAWQAVLWKAAAILFFVSTAVLLADKIGEGERPEVTTIDNKSGKGNGATTAGQMEQVQEDEFQDVEYYYTSLIEEKKKEINRIFDENGQVFDTKDADMKKLDAMYLVLKEELDKNPSKQVVDALILNLLIRIDLLNSQLDMLEETEKQQI